MRLNNSVCVSVCVFRESGQCVCVKRVDITDTGGHVYEAKQLCVCVCLEIVDCVCMCV